MTTPNIKAKIRQAIAIGGKFTLPFSVGTGGTLDEDACVAGEDS